MTVLLENQAAEKQLKIDRIRETAEALLEYTGWNESELSILLVDDFRITELNAAYRKKDKPTNVLAFPLLEPEETDFPVLLGDIVISVETAAREAGQQKTALEDYLAVLLVHGLIHLLGFDHATGEKEAGEMAEEERKLLKKLNRDRLVSLDVDSLTIPV